MENFEQIHLPWQDWKIVKRLGGGAYGEVYEIERNISGVQEKATVKIVSRPKDDIEIETYYDEGYDKASIVASYEKEIQNYVQEYTLMKKLQGQTNIVSCDDFTVVPHDNGIGGDVFIRMELLTSLQQVLRQKTLSVQEIKKVVPDLDQRIMKDTEFAKSVDSAIIGHHSEMMKYITRLNPEAGKELQNMAEKKK